MYLGLAIYNLCSTTRELYCLLPFVTVRFSEELPGEQLDVRDVPADLVHVVVLLGLLVVKLILRRRPDVLLTDNTWRVTINVKAILKGMSFYLSGEVYIRCLLIKQ